MSVYLYWLLYEISVTELRNVGKGVTLMARRKGSLLRISTKDQSYDAPAPSEPNLLHTKKEKENT